MIYISQGSLFLALPEVAGFKISPIRMQAERTAVAGNLIRQESVLHASSAMAVYARDLPADTAAILRTMHAASSAVVVHFRNVGYAATMRAEFEDKAGGMVAVSMRLGIVRQLQ
jgi:hypothetical protein